MKRLVLILNLALLPLSSSKCAQPDSARAVMNLLVINYDPMLREHGAVHLSKFMKWNDARAMTTNLVRYIAEASGG